MRTGFLVVGALLLCGYANAQQTAKEWCSVNSQGNNTTIQLSCTGVDPQIIEAIKKKIDALGIQAPRATQTAEANRLAQEFFRYRATLERIDANTEATRQAWEYLRALDFDKLSKLLDDIPQIKSQTTGPFTADPDSVVRARNTLERTWTTLVAAKAPERCPNYWSELSRSRNAAQDAQTRGLLEAAGQIYERTNERAEALMEEIQFSMEWADMPRGWYEQLLPTVRTMRDLVVEQFNAPPNVVRKPPTAQQRDFFQRAQKALADGEALARNGAYAEAYDKIQEANELFTGVQVGRVIAIGRVKPDPVPYPNPQCR